MQDDDTFPISETNYATEIYRPMSKSTSILISLAVCLPAIIWSAYYGNLLFSIGIIPLAVWFGIKAAGDGSDNGESAPHWDQEV